MNWSMEVLQTSALPLGYAASVLERETGFEPATSTLARLHSTTELLPLKWRRRPDLNRRMEVLQTSALPLGYVALSVFVGAGDGI